MIPPSERDESDPGPGALAGGWTEIRVDVPQGWHELVAETLAFGPCTSVVLGTTSVAAPAPPSGHEVVRTFVMAKDDTDALRGETRARLTNLADAAGAPELTGLTPRFKRLPPEDYTTSWRKDWKPYRVGRLVLLPPWRSEGPPRESDLRLTIEPGGSFGSGRHATTRTCLRVLDRRLSGGERVLDAGAGSGVLSVASALLGASSTLGFDIDPASKSSGDELAEINGTGERCTFREGDFSALRDADTGFDVILANIYADVLQAHMPELARRLAASGWFAFSGCRVDHRDPTVEAIVAAGLEIHEERRRGRWITFVGGHSSSARNA